MKLLLGKGNMHCIWPHFLRHNFLFGCYEMLQPCSPKTNCLLPVVVDTTLFFFSFFNFLQDWSFIFT